MQLEILSVPEQRGRFVRNLTPGLVLPLTMRSVGESSDSHWFIHEGEELCVDDLIVNGIEFKVIHEEA